MKKPAHRAIFDRNSITDKIYRDCTGGSVSAQDHDSGGGISAVGERDVDSIHPELSCPLMRSPVKPDRGNSVAIADDFDVTPGDPPGELISRECLEGSLLRCQANRRMLRWQRLVPYV